MTGQVNPKGADWLRLKGWMLGRIEEYHRQMEVLLPNEDYHQLRGSILAYREVIEMVEPSATVTEKEDDYGISGEGQGNY